ncbi:hypothetical protein HDU93_000406 [Gonapodya sp. JEL0774]|nr:hypothetical protein HDU93_000406 [Gonapodya sp. JEL0774]
MLYLQIKGINWVYDRTSNIMPRPNLTPDLSGGYRRIPILQIGADVYCDTNCIIRELERRYPTPSLRGSGEHEGMSYALHVWSDKLFFGAAVGLMPWKSDVQIPQAFIKDREQLSGGRINPEAIVANQPRARDQFRVHLDFLETQLASSKTGWVLSTENVHLADVQCWTPIRFAAMFAMEPNTFNEQNYPNIFRWYKRVTSLGFTSPNPYEVPNVPLVSSETAYAVAELASRSGAFAQSLGTDPKDANGRKVGDIVGVVPEDQAMLGRGPVVTGELYGSNATTISVRWKNGSVILKRISQLGRRAIFYTHRGSFGFSSREYKYKEALKKYYEALNLASSADEYLSTLKNISLAHFRVAELILLDEERSINDAIMRSASDEWEDCPVKTILTGSKLTAYMYSIKESLLHLSLAVGRNRLVASGASKPQQWIDSIEEHAIQVLDHAKLVIYAIPDSHVERIHVSHLRSLCRVFDAHGNAAVPPPFAPAARLYVDTAQKILHRAVSISESEETTVGGRPKHYVCLSLLADINEPLSQAERFARGSHDESELTEEILALHEDVELLRKTVQSVHERENGDRILNIATKGSEELTIEGVWAAYDHYKQSALLTRELDVENEAIAFSRMGRVWKDVLKDAGRAHACFLRCVELAQTLYPRDLTTRPWYQLATNSMIAHRAYLAEREQTAAQKEKEPFLAQLTSELAALDAASDKGTVDLLTHVYATHPPKGEGLVMGPTESGTLKKTVRQAVIHYYPDRQQNKADGRLWEILCEEISKRLNAKYENLKE